MKNPRTDFTYKGYEELLSDIVKKGYYVTAVNSYTEERPIVILRHDIDLSVEKALPIFEIEKTLGISSTYFFLVGSEAYNVCTKRNAEIVKKISSSGFEIGLHFDRNGYENENELKESVIEHIFIMSEIAGKKVNSLSWHMPKKELLGVDVPWLEKEGITNTYSAKFFEEFAYCSDSNMNWRTDPYSFLEPKEYKKIQLLTHPVWYGENEDKLGIVNEQMLKRIIKVKESFETVVK